MTATLTQTRGRSQAFPALTAIAHSHDVPATGNDAPPSRFGDDWAGLAALAAAGIPIPAGFAVAGDASASANDLTDAVAAVEARSGKRFGHGPWPLVLTAWRADPAAAVPFVGVNDETSESLIAASGDEAFGPDAYQQLIRAYGRVVAGIPDGEFADALTRLKQTRGLTNDVALAHEDWDEVVRRFKAIFERHAGSPFPQDPAAQLSAVVAALTDGPSAATVQEMVFGNMSADSGTGRAATGSVDPIRGTFVPNVPADAQVDRAGLGIDCDGQLARWSEPVRRSVADAVDALGRCVGPAAEFEFTVERGRLFVF